MSGARSQEWVDEKRRKRFDAIDSMPKELRDVVNEYSMNVVRAFLDIGVKKPKHIRHLVETVLDEFSPTRGAFSAQGIRTIHSDTREK